mmetsp:Transcript_92218/g.269861  ORF Transcript_92218/g.269861 Transcript_92218/m.269861 type:complete len:237 (-) Transcript_92218:1395-2105(-)
MPRPARRGGGGPGRERHARPALLQLEDLAVGVVQHAPRSCGLGGLHCPMYGLRELAPVHRLRRRAQRRQLMARVSLEPCSVVERPVGTPAHVPLHLPELLPERLRLVPHGAPRALAQLAREPAAPWPDGAHGADGRVQVHVAVLGGNRPQGALHVAVLDACCSQSRLELPRREILFRRELLLQGTLALGQAAEALAKLPLELAESRVGGPEGELVKEDLLRHGHLTRVLVLTESRC